MWKGTEGGKWDLYGGGESHQDPGSRIRIQAQDGVVKEGDGEDVEDARAALGRWKAGERTGVSLETASKQQQLQQLAAAAAA